MKGGVEWPAERILPNIADCRYPGPKGRCYGNHFLAFDGL